MSGRWSLPLAALLLAGIAQGQTTQPHTTQAQLGRESVLRVASVGNLGATDPGWTTADATQTLSYLIYETLFALDAARQPQPQLVERHETSADGLLWRFTLREGLAFHDGSPVTATDAAASLRRWMARAVDGRILASRLAALEVQDARRFSLRLTRPYGPMLESLANQSSLMPVILRAADAGGDVDKPVQGAIGTGPFVFEPASWVPGSSWRLHRNPAYRPRAEPPSGMAGGHVPKLDRIEFHFIPDANTAANALVAREIDLIELASYDLLPVLRRDPGIAIRAIDDFGYQVLVRPNALHPPFNDPRARQALLYLASAAEYLGSVTDGEVALHIPCASPFVCGAGLPAPRDIATPDLPRARALLREAGYRGETVVLLAMTDQPEMYQAASILAQRLRDIGVTVDQQDMDFASLAARRANREDPATSRGGWSLFVTGRSRPTASGPIINGYLSTSCDGRNFFGWPCDAGLEALRLGFLDATTPEARDASLHAIADRFFEALPYVPLGNISRPMAYRDTVRGIVAAPALVFWNMEKAGP